MTRAKNVYYEKVGSPIIIVRGTVEAPKFIKMAASMPCLRANIGLVKPGHVGRIVSRKQKDLWAVRLSIGTTCGQFDSPLERIFQMVNISKL
ncbi:unnamed protein product [Arabidopsis halleri]